MTQPAIAYIRTSSLSNVAGDSQQRQQAAILAFAKTAGFEIVSTYTDEGVSGTVALDGRPGFTSLMNRIEGNGVCTIIVEDSSRLARDMLTQEIGVMALADRGVRVLTATGEDLTETTDPTKVMMRQIAGAFAQYEKSRLVAKLKAARDRKRAAGKKVEGRKSHAELRPEVVAMAKRLRRRSPKTGKRLSYLKIAAELARQGHVSAAGTPFSASAVKSMTEK